MSNTLRLLDELEKLNGLPLEKEGLKIKEGLNIDKALTRKTEDISGPYILIEGDRDKAISLAAYIYLEKSKVYSDIDLREKLKGMDVKSRLRKAEEAENVYLELSHDIDKKGKVTVIYYKCYRDGRRTNEAGCLGLYYDIPAGYYQWENVEEDKFSNVKGRPIKTIYMNHFRWADWIINPSELNQLELMHKGFASSMTCFDMLKFKNTVFLSDFMKDRKDKACPELLEFAQKVHVLKKNKPGFLIVHTDDAMKFPAHFRKLFQWFPLGSGKKKDNSLKEKDNFDDVKLKAVVHWKTSYSDSNYKFIVKHKESSDYEELEIDPRDKPVLYRLIKGVMESESPIDYVSKQDLIEAFYPRKDIDDAIRNIKKEFVKIIGPRGKKIIDSEYAMGRRLLIRKKNIKIKEYGNPLF